MEKLIFLFRRKAGMSREAYHHHYITNHAPLGLRVVDHLVGYTTNMVESRAGYDAVTEIWTPSAARFAGGGSTSTEDAQAVIADHISFMGPQDCFAVEERVLRDGALGSPVGEPSEDAKQVQLFGRDEALPAPAPDAYRVVDNVVLRAVYVEDRPGAESDLAVIRTSWAKTPDALGPPSENAMMVREYRQRLMAAEPA